MLERVLYTTVFVSDQDEALDFYTNVLGFEKGFENTQVEGPRFLSVGIKGQDDFQLVLWPGTPGQGKPVQGRNPAAYTLQTSDIHSAYETLKGRGVKFDTEVLEFPWGQIAVFEDPDGNRLQLREAA